MKIVLKVCGQRNPTSFWTKPTTKNWQTKNLWLGDKNFYSIDNDYSIKTDKHSCTNKTK